MTIGIWGAEISTSARASRIASAAGDISEQWKGALTGNSTARFAPASFARSIARATAAAEPEITTWPGALSLAALQISSSVLASAAISTTLSKSGPNRAAIAPTPTGTACCMALPRIRSNFAVSASVNAPDAAKAEYSPRL